MDNNRSVASIDIAVGGAYGFSSHRVPGIVTTTSGKVLLYWEGRKNSTNERAVLLSTSCDGGKHFSPVQTLICGTEETFLHNPLMIAGPDDSVWSFWCENYRKLFVCKSSDGGQTFAEPRELTTFVEQFRNKWPMTLWAISPGHGICLRKNSTLVLPLWLSCGENAHLPACFACIYSDDFGETWKTTSIVRATDQIGDPTEAAIAECSDGTLLATLRHEKIGIRRRAFCRGTLGHWGEPYLDDNLPDPICGGSLLSLLNGKMVFANCAYGDEAVLRLQKQGKKLRWSNDARQQLTVRASYDDGRNWSHGIVLAQEGGASDLALSEDGEYVYCFFEREWVGGNCIFTNRLSFVALPLATLFSE